jgi:hypothetical protein
VIDSFAPIDKATLDYVLPLADQGYPAHLAAGDTRDVLIDVCRGAGAKPRDFPKELWIEPKDWAAKAKENDENNTWPMNFIDRYTNQSPTHECTTHSISRGFEAARNRQRGLTFSDGPKAGFRYEHSKNGVVWVSVMSVYAEANPGQWGGASIRGPMEIAARRGWLPDKMQPAEYKFKHTLAGTAGRGNNNQSSGSWTRVGGFPPGWEETAKLFRIDQVIFPSSFEEAVCLVLHGRFVHVGRSGHAIPWGQARFDGNEFAGMAYPDSYDTTRVDSAGTVRRVWGGSFAIDTVTVPDNWLDPAGTLAT